MAGLGLILAVRSCSLLKVDPQVLHRHPVIGVRATFAICIRDGLKDKASSLPQCRHICLDRYPLSQVISHNSSGQFSTDSSPLMLDDGRRERTLYLCPSRAISRSAGQTRGS